MTNDEIMKMAHAAGYKPVPVEPTGEMLRAMSSSKAVDNDGEFPSLSDLIGYSGDDKTLAVMKAAYAAMLAAAPEAPAQQPTIPQGYKLVPVDQTQGEMGALPEIVERVLRSAGKTRRETSNPRITANECIKLANWIVANTNPQPAQQPLTDEQIAAATGARPGTPMWLVAVAFTRAIEHAHGIK